jgi:hypothetical protein
MPKRRPLAERLWEKVDKNGPLPAGREVLGHCWLWLGAKANGYGRIGTGEGNRAAQAHRVAYELLVGPIPDGLTIDHMCVNPSCVNPEHMEPVTRGVNTLRGRSWGGENARKTHCPQGHPYDEANTWYDPSGGRACLTCKPGRGKGRFRRTGQCKHGHELTGDNIYIAPRGYWQCRECKRQAIRRFQDRKKAA